MFYVPERVLIFLKADKDSKGRLLSAGFHLMTGYFRYDAPLSALLLNEAQQRELDRLWDEFHFVTLDSIRQYKDFIAHYHTGGVPGRNEIDETQELNYTTVCKAIVDTGFTGFLAQEFIPKRADVMASLKQGVQICDV